MPDLPVGAVDPPPAVPLPPVHLRPRRQRQGGLRAGRPSAASAADRRRRRGLSDRHQRLHRAGGPELLGTRGTMSTSVERAAAKPAKPSRIGSTANYLDERLGLAGALRKNLRKVFPDHWSFMLGEIALWSFVVLLVTGVLLTLWFDPSMAEVEYEGSYEPLRGISMSRAYASALEISFDVRGGLLLRQIHHWAAMIFIAGMFVHMMRVYFTRSEERRV